MRKMRMTAALCFVAFAMGAAAQTVVTSTGTTATVGNAPFVSSATSTSTTLSPSPISVSNGNVGIGTPNPNAALVVNGSYGYLLDATRRNRLWFDQSCKRYRVCVHGLLCQSVEQFAARLGSAAVESKSELVKVIV